MEKKVTISFEIIKKRANWIKTSYKFDRQIVDYKFSKVMREIKRGKLHNYFFI